MKILVLSDIHENWSFNLSFIKSNKDSVDYVVTLGDYVDSFKEDLNGFTMQQGFLKLIELARAEPEKFRIILGNHDHSYISRQSCSGHYIQYAKMYEKMFTDNLDIIYPTVLIDRVLFSHAGVSLQWYEKVVGFYNDKYKYNFVPKRIMSEYKRWDYNNRNIEKVYFNGEVKSLVIPKNEKDKEYIKEYYKYRDFTRENLEKVYKEMTPYFKNSLPMKFSVNNLRKIMLDDLNSLCHCGYSSTGDSSGESCLWIRPNSLIKDRWPKGIKCQVVGHTEIGLKKFKYGQHKLIVCDNRTHNCGFTLDTENIGEDFEKLEFPKPKISKEAFEIFREF